MDKKKEHWTVRTPSARNDYPMWKAVGVAVLIVILTSLIASSFPTYGYGQTTFDPDGVRNLGSAIKAASVWLAGISLALFSLVAGLVERMRCRSAAPRQEPSR